MVCIFIFKVWHLGNSFHPIWVCVWAQSINVITRESRFPYPAVALRSVSLEHGPLFKCIVLIRQVSVKITTVFFLISRHVWLKNYKMLMEIMPNTSLQSSGLHSVTSSSFGFNLWVSSNSFSRYIKKSQGFHKSLNKWPKQRNRRLPPDIAIRQTTLFACLKMCVLKSRPWELHSALKLIWHSGLTVSLPRQVTVPESLFPIKWERSICRTVDKFFERL